jgi:hypothetical protein
MDRRPWTYSQLDSFESCPRKFYHAKVKRDFPEPPSVHTVWGNRVHEAFEVAIKDGTELPDDMKQWQGLATKLQNLPGSKLTEHKYAIDRDFKPTGWSDAWSRGIADLVVLSGEKAAVLDFKTGKRKPTEQLDLYANYVFHHHPEVNKVTTGFVWLRDKRIDWKPVDRSSISGTWQSLLPRVVKLESAYDRDSWPARPSGLCKGWCPVTSCEFYRSKG